MKYQLKVVKVEDSAELVAFVPLCAVFSPHLMLVPSWETLKDTGNICRSNCLVLADHQQLGIVNVIVIVLQSDDGLLLLLSHYCYCQVMADNQKLGMASLL